MPWKCKNKDCGRTFEVLGRISTEKRGSPAAGFYADVTRIIIESPCCPFCQSLEFELAKNEP